MVEQLCKAGSHDPLAQLNLWLKEALADKKILLHLQSQGSNLRFTLTQPVVVVWDYDCLSR